MRFRKVSDYAVQLREKQKVKRIYGVGERQFRTLFSKAARELLESNPETVVVVAKAVDGGSLLKGTEAACPDLVLLEWDLPGRPKAELIAALRNLNTGQSSD